MEVKAPFMFDGEHGVALHTMQGNQASPCGKGEFSWFFLSCGWNPGYILELQWGGPFKTCVCSATSGFLSSWEGHLGILVEDWECNLDAPRGEAVDPGSLSSCHRDIWKSYQFSRGVRDRLLLKH